MSRLGAFKGFPAEAFSLLAALEANNNRDWFRNHQERYEQTVVQPALSFIEDLAVEIRRFAPSVRPEPFVGGSLFRVQRDVRFSADKRPFKTHVGIRLRAADVVRSARCEGPLFYVELDARRLRLGVGVKAFDTPTRAAYLDQVLEDASIYSKAEATATRGSHQILGQVLKRPPPGTADHPRAMLLRRKGFFVVVDAALPRSVRSRAMIAHCVAFFSQYRDLFSALHGAARAGLKS